MRYARTVVQIKRLRRLGDRVLPSEVELAVVKSDVRSIEVLGGINLELKDLRQSLVQLPGRHITAMKGGLGVTWTHQRLVSSGEEERELGISSVGH